MRNPGCTSSALSSEEKIKKLKDLLAKEDATKEDIDNAAKELSDALQKVGAAMYEQVKKEEEEGKKKGEEKKPEEKSEEDKGKDEAEEGEVVKE